ncbi:MAG: hypothetical protein R3275_08475 [Saprospiraceae bacterium]|nr:hypothetical protein [Saprospiraceae bacterium]
MRHCALVIAILTTVTITAQTPLIEELQLARKQYELKEFDRARINFESLEVHNALAVEDIRRLALCYEALGYHDEAIYRWNQVLMSGKYTNKDLLSLADLLKSQARYDESLQILEGYKERGGELADHYIESCRFAKRVVTEESRCDLENLALNTSSAETGVSFHKGELVYATHFVDLQSRFSIKGEMDNRPKAVLLSTPDGENVDHTDPLKVQDREGDSFGFVSYAANGRLMVYVKSEFKADASAVEKAYDGMALFYAVSDESGAWKDDIAFPFNSTEYDNGFPFVSDDGKSLFYSSDMPGGSGGFDIYVSHFENGNWTLPENLGPEVNTPGNEITPYLSDGKLYFASDWLPGLGGYDVYSIHNVDNHWMGLAHMGACVNSPADDFGFVMDPARKSAYFTSSRKGGKGYDDIYRIRDHNNISEIELVSTRAMEVPEIGSRRITQDRQIEGELIYKTDGDLKQSDLSGQKMTVRERDDEDIVRLELLMHHKLDEAPVQVSSNDLPQLNFDVIDLAREGTVELAPLEIDNREMSETYPVASGLTKKGIDIERKEEAISEKMIDDIGLPSEVTDLSQYLIFDDPVIRNMVLVPQEKVYFIQIAALRLYTSDLDRFDHFKRYGNVYKVNTGGMVKIRIGYFRTQREAVSVLEDLKRRGIREAFVVGDILDAERMELLASPLDAEEGEIVNLSNDDLVPSYISKYKVRVASYQWPSRFQTSQIADLGHIEHWTKGPWKIILLSGYSTKEQALEVLEICKKRGYEDAYIVKDKEGTLKRIE